jgi:hypothetical protein
MDSFGGARCAARSQANVFRHFINAWTSPPLEVVRCRTLLAQLLKLSVHDEQPHRAVIIQINLLQKFLHAGLDHAKRRCQCSVW